MYYRAEQEDKYKLERIVIARIESICKEHGIPFEDVHKDTSTGIDVMIDGNPYDLKASLSGKLTLYKELPDGTVYCPLNEHKEIPYLIPNEYGILCVLNKTVGKKWALENINQKAYLGDGNINVTFTYPQVNLIQPLLVRNVAFDIVTTN